MEMQAGEWSFPGEILTFLLELRANNDRVWFKEHKAVYIRAVQEPAREFGQAMETELGKLTGVPHSSKIFRMHRDLRFSKDKTPYNTHLHISFAPVEAQMVTPMWHFGLEPGCLTVGAGVFDFGKQGLQTYRAQVAGRQGVILLDLLDQITSAGGRVSEPALKRVPSGYECSEEQAYLLRHKGLTVWRDLPDVQVAVQGGIIKRCMADYARLAEFAGWLGRLND